MKKTFILIIVAAASVSYSQTIPASASETPERLAGLELVTARYNEGQRAADTNHVDLTTRQYADRIWSGVLDSYASIAANEKRAEISTEIEQSKDAGVTEDKIKSLLMAYREADAAKRQAAEDVLTKAEAR